MRMHAQTATIENGFVHLPQAAPWLAEYLHELAVFPNSRHDDQVFAYYRMLAEERRRKQGLTRPYRVLARDYPPWPPHREWREQPAAFATIALSGRDFRSASAHRGPSN
jgi:hypothetical protein